MEQIQFLPTDTQKCSNFFFSSANFNRIRHNFFLNFEKNSKCFPFFYKIIENLKNISNLGTSIGNFKNFGSNNVSDILYFYEFRIFKSNFSQFLNKTLEQIQNFFRNSDQTSENCANFSSFRYFSEKKFKNLR